MKSSDITTNYHKNNISNFLAIAFETANYYRVSACAVELVSVENPKIVAKEAFLIRPPGSWFVFSYSYGITRNDVEDRPTFKDLWPSLKRYLRGKDFILAYNALFTEVFYTKVVNILSCCLLINNLFVK